MTTAITEKVEESEREETEKHKKYYPNTEYIIEAYATDTRTHFECAHCWNHLGPFAIPLYQITHSKRRWCWCCSNMIISSHNTNTNYRSLAHSLTHTHTGHLLFILASAITCIVCCFSNVISSVLLLLLFPWLVYLWYFTCLINSNCMPTTIHPKTDKKTQTPALLLLEFSIYCPCSLRTCLFSSFLVFFLSITLTFYLSFSIGSLSWVFSFSGFTMMLLLAVASFVFHYIKYIFERFDGGFWQRWSFVVA